jgi:hypothetical protein
MRKEFDLSKITSIKGASISEYTMYSDKIARVVANFVGTMDASEARDRLSSALGNQATPIRSSFRWLEQGRSALGFVQLTPQVRSYEEKTIKAKYHMVTANVFMDPTDDSIWEVKPGSGGNYLARKGQENLADLIEASRTGTANSAPRMASIVSASISQRPNQFVAFVSTQGMVDYGFCTKASASAYDILSTTTSEIESVAREGVVGVYTVEIPANIHAGVTSNKVKSASAGPGDVSAQIEYYRKAYSYAPEYVEMLIRQVEQQAAI